MFTTGVLLLAWLQDTENVRMKLREDRRREVREKFEREEAEEKAREERLERNRRKRRQRAFAKFLQSRRTHLLGPISALIIKRMLDMLNECVKLGCRLKIHNG